MSSQFANILFCVISVHLQFDQLFIQNSIHGIVHSTVLGIHANGSSSQCLWVWLIEALFPGPPNSFVLVAVSDQKLEVGKESYCSGH